MNEKNGIQKEELLNYFEKILIHQFETSIKEKIVKGCEILGAF